MSWKRKSIVGNILYLATEAQTTKPTTKRKKLKSERIRKLYLSQH